jgi:hypothetical protein
VFYATVYKYTKFLVAFKLIITNIFSLFKTTFVCSCLNNLLITYSLFVLWWGEVGRSRNHLICRMQGLDNSYSCTEDFVYIDQLPIWAVRYQAIQGQTVSYD